MDLKQFLHDDDAVSPVIGVILMVAITVILAAVIASFVLGLGDTAGDAAPQVSWSWSIDADGSGAASGENLGGDSEGLVTLTHDGGDSIDPANVEITNSDGTIQGSTAFSGSSEISAGSSVEFGVNNPGEIRLIWNDPDGGSSSILSTYEV